MAEPLEKKISKKKEKKKIRKQQETLNNVGEAKWRRLGAFASWVGYRIDTEDGPEYLPVRKNASKIDLMNISNNLKRYAAKRKALELERKKRKSRKTP